MNAAEFGGGALEGRYEIERELGEGGMAIVYLARDVKHGRSVAVKVVKPEFGSVLGAGRFLTEIDIIAKLQHPNILPLYDSGDAQGSLYYVMPFMDGQSLRERLERDRQLPLDDVAKITGEIAQGLQHAHSQGIVHRDIKPENILFSGGVAVMADFGIARALAVAGGDRLTQAGVSIGTPRYMSPEQATSDAVDARSDVYSLGCVVYEMLAGDPPFVGSSSTSVMARHARDPVPSIRSIRPAVPIRVESVVTRALAKVPADRYQTVRAFSDALHSALLASQPGARRPLAQRVTIGIAGTLVVAAAGILLWQRSGFATPPGPPRIIVLPFEHVGVAEDRFITDGMADEVTSRVAGISGLAVIARASALHYHSAGADLRDVAKETNVSYVVTGSVRTDHAPDGTSRVRVTPHLIRIRGEREIWSETFDAKFVPGELFAMQSGIAGRVANALGVTLLLPEQAQLQARPTADAAAYDAYLRGNLYSTRRYEEESARRAIEMYQRAITIDPKFALAYAKLAEAQTVYTYYYKDKVAKRLQLARDAIQRATELDSTLIEVRLARGYLYWWGELDADRALGELNAVRAVQPNNSDILWLIAQVQRRKGQLADAAATTARAVELDPRSHLLALDLAVTYLSLRHYEEAEAEINRAVALAPDWAPAVVMKALLRWSSSGDPREALKVVEGALPRVSMREMLKWMYRYPSMPGQLGGAVQDSVEALSTDADFIDSAKLFLAKGYSFRFRGDSARSRVCFDSARVALERRSRLAPDDAELHALLGIAYAGVGRRADARREGDAAIRMLPLSRDLLMGGTLLSHRIDIAVVNGDSDDALTHVGTMIRMPTQYSRAMLRNDPFYAGLRTNARYAGIANGPEVRY